MGNFKHLSFTDLRLCRQQQVRNIQEFEQNLSRQKAHLYQIDDEIADREKQVKEANEALVKQIGQYVTETDNGVQITTPAGTQVYVKAEIAYDWRDKYNKLLKTHNELVSVASYAHKKTMEFFESIKL